MNMMQSRQKALLEMLQRGLLLSSEQQTKAMLGDRSAYLGMSDIGRYADCPRAAVANKLMPKKPSLERLLALQRGHWFEKGVGDALAALNLAALPQLEIRTDKEETPIRAHLDFTLVSEYPVPTVRILEVKSMETLPKEAYPAHERQITGQVALLAEYWNEPAFSLKQNDGTVVHNNLSFPELCRRELGVNLPDDPGKASVEGWLLCLSMHEARAFGPYLPDAYALEALKQEAAEYWDVLGAVREGRVKLNDIPHARGFYPLCASCAHAGDCPRFPQAAVMPQWEEALDKLSALKEQRTGLDSEIREIENALRLAHRLATPGEDGRGDWINSGSYRFRVSQTDARRTLDREGLREELAEMLRQEHLESIDVDALFARHEKIGAASSRLLVNKIT